MERNSGRVQTEGTWFWKHFISHVFIGSIGAVGNRCLSQLLATGNWDTIGKDDPMMDARTQQLFTHLVL